MCGGHRAWLRADPTTVGMVASSPDLALTVRAPGGPGRGDVRLGLENWAY
jgi:hypothetical protein